MIGATHTHQPLVVDRQSSAWSKGKGRPNPEDFEDIYRQYHKRVHSLCLRMTRNEADAEDLTQDAFIQLFRKLDTFRGESSFYTWLYRLVVNVALMRLRRTRKSLETSLEDFLEPDSQAGLPPREIALPDTELLGVPERLSLERALEDLPSGYRVVLVLHDVEGYEHHEISQMVSCSVGTSKSQLHKARVRMRKLLGSCSGRKARPGLLPVGEERAARRSAPAGALLAA